MFANFGPSHVLLTENTLEYVADKLKFFLKNYNCKRVEISTHHTSSNGFSERINREVNKLLRIYTAHFAINNWDTLLPVIQLCINSPFNASIGEALFYALFAHDSSVSSLTPPNFSYSDDSLMLR